MQASKKIVAALLLGTLGMGMMSPAMAQRGPGPDEAGMGGMFDFDQFDADKDGKVTQAELEASRTARVKAADANADGMMNADELTAMLVTQMTERAKAMSAEMITRLDSDGDGQLSAAEFAARPGPEGMFDRIDANSDGAISREEADAAKAKMKERRGDRMHRHHDDRADD